MTPIGKKQKQENGKFVDWRNGDFRLTDITEVKYYQDAKCPKCGFSESFAWGLDYAVKEFRCGNRRTERKS